MSSGSHLSTGFYRTDRVSEDEMWSAFAYLFSPKAKFSASYKYGFLKSILDNLYNVDENLVLTFDQLFSKFAEIYWNLVLKHHIKQNVPGKNGKYTKLEQTLWEAKDKYSIEDGIPFESLTLDMKKYIYARVKKGCKENVVGALYGDLQELFYSFDKRGEWIRLNPQMYEFVCKHKTAIEKLNYYEWAKYLERINEDDVMDHLLTKIDESAKRNNLAYYRDILFQEFENRCFYCGEPVTTNHVNVDHFIPWSFIKDDKLWNFVLSCPKCNNSKKDKLAPETELKMLVNRNATLIEKINLEDMKNYQSAKLLRIYNFAKDNGYKDIWVPKRKTS